MITLIGLGNDLGEISYSAIKALKGAERVYARTLLTKSAEIFKQENIACISFDELYTKSKSFDTLNAKIYKELVKASRLTDIVYCVDGSIQEDRVCQRLMQKKKCRVFSGVSKASKALSLCGLGGAYSSVSAHDIEALSDNPIFPLVVFDIDDILVAGRVKLALADFFGDEVLVKFIYQGKVNSIPLYELDRMDGYDYTTAVVITASPLEEKARYNFDDLLQIIRVLRGENGCPWDRAQTKESITKNLIEECYELVDAINLDDDDKMREEIGDNLLQSAFHIIFAEERGAFNKSDVLSEVCAKLIYRHSHIFGEDKATTEGDALNVWEKNKMTEKNMDSAIDAVRDVPKCFPALMRAQKVYKRAVKGGYEKLSEQELYKLIAEEKDVGSLLFYTAMLCYATDQDAEEALYKKIEAFVEEFCSDKKD